MGGREFLYSVNYDYYTKIVNWMQEITKRNLKKLYVIICRNMSKFVTVENTGLFTGNMIWFLKGGNMEELNEKIIELMVEKNIWKELYNIEFNKNPSGQSLTFFIKEKEERLYIAKFFNYMQGLNDDTLECLKIDATTIEDFENKLADNSTNLNVEEILECIDLSKRSFDRYIEVCSKTEGLFPKLYTFKDNIKIGKRFYGLLIEEFVKGSSLKEEIKTVKREEIDIYDYAISFLVKISDTIKKYTNYGFVHRDISPDNIIITEDGPVIIDPRVYKNSW